MDSLDLIKDRINSFPSEYVNDYIKREIVDVAEYIIKPVDTNNAIESSSIQASIRIRFSHILSHIEELYKIADRIKKETYASIHVDIITNPDKYKVKLTKNIVESLIVNDIKYKEACIEYDKINTIMSFIKDIHSSIIDRGFALNNIMYDRKTINKQL